MEFFFALFFLLFYYLRPQDWVPGLSGVELIKPIIGLWVFFLLAARSRPSPLKGWLRTPHDWVVHIYLGYIVFFGDASITEVLPFLAFYVLTLQSVNTWPRLLGYLKFWTYALVMIAALGVLSTVGIDPTHAQDNYFTQLGRLAIGTWLHDNPNALGHSIVVAIPAAYLIFAWKGNAIGRIIVFPAIAAIVFYCAWLTQSKGSYVVGGLLVVITLILGKPWWIQLATLVIALTVGVSALSFLPRMEDMSDLGSDEGVQGRLLAWEMAKTVEQNNHTGIGWRQFIAQIPWQEGGQTIIVPKATHSSYVQIGADLGRYGLFLYLAGLWCAFHTLIVFRSSDSIEERCRRILIILLIANAISGWMINRQYHTEYFLLIAASAALHRLKKAEEVLPEPDKAESRSPDAAITHAPFWGLAQRIHSASPAPAFTLSARGNGQVEKFWNRFGFLDLLCSTGLTILTFWTWDYVLKNL
ncbi:MAG: O-antigen ligase family protein [Verrucomicrobiae bacterium]|nr:O-antigen ligase family protein [Verrucomicrobiae bacterium]